MGNRRDWLKGASLGVLAVTFGQYKSLANPTTEYIPFKSEDSRILLRSNENPYGPSPKARAAMSESINKSNRYGWNLTSELISEIAEKNDISENNILLGAGSTEILDLVFQFSSQKNGNYILADTTYDYWTSTKNQRDFERINVPLTEDKKHNLDAMLDAIRTDTKLIYICNPNNPTGTICKSKELTSFIKKTTNQTLVLVDEAYIDFTDEKSLSHLATDNENLIVAKTFSKMYGLAGARIGYAVANASTINKLTKLKSWPNGSLSAMSMAGAVASLNDDLFIKKVKSLNEKVKNYS